MNSISSFAEDLILQDIQEVKEGKALPPALRDTMPKPDGKDIRNTKVPETFMQQVLGEEYVPSSDPDPEIIEEASEFFGTEPTEVIEEDFQSIILEVRELLKEVKGILTEITTVGRLGVNLGGKSEDPFKKENDKRHKQVLKILKKRVNKRK